MPACGACWPDGECLTLEEAVRRLCAACRKVGRAWPFVSSAWPTSVPHLPVGQPRVLVLGVYLADRKNTVAHLVDAFGASRHCRVEQHWVALGHTPPPAQVAAVTAQQERTPAPKFVLINRLLRAVDRDAFDYVIVCDDDIHLPDRFIDRFIGWQQHLGFSLAQPARTWDSDSDHHFVRRKLRVRSRARETRFVEIGPLFCMDRRFAPLLLPFDESSPMGWGYDYVWPVVARQHGLRMGIIDDVPMAHLLRKQGSLYDSSGQRELMRDYLARHEHLAANECFTVLRRHH
jgi:hypothetical protein